MLETVFGNINALFSDYSDVLGPAKYYAPIMRVNEWDYDLDPPKRPKMTTMLIRENDMYGWMLAAIREGRLGEHCRDLWGFVDNDSQLTVVFNTEHDKQRFQIYMDHLRAAADVAAEEKGGFSLDAVNSDAETLRRLTGKLWTDNWTRTNVLEPESTPTHIEVFNAEPGSG